MLSLIKKNTLLIISLIFISLFFVKNNIFVDTAQKYTAEIAKDSAAVYVSLRLLNAALSFAQEIEVTGSVVIASGTIKPFKVIEPLDDTVEKLSKAIFYIGAFAATATVIIEFFGHYSFLLVGVASGVLYIMDRLKLIENNSVISIFLKNINSSASIILLVVVSFVVSSLIADKMYAAKWKNYNKVLEDVSSELTELVELDPPINTEISSDETEANTVQPIDQSEEADGWASKITSKVGEAVEGITSTGSKIKNNVVEATTKGVSAVSDKYKKAEKIIKIFWEKKGELSDALSGIFALFLFKTFALPLLLFLFFLGCTKNLTFIKHSK